MLAWLIPNPHNPNELITAPCTSPEADYITDKDYRGSSFYGGTADLAIIRELFKNTIKGAKALSIDNVTSSSCNQLSIACALTTSGSEAI